MNRNEYYDRLMDVRLKDDYESWIKFFLRGIIIASTDAINMINKIINLHNININKIDKLIYKSKNTIYLSGFAFFIVFSPHRSL